MTDAHGIYIPRDLIVEGFDDDCTPECLDIEAPSGRGFVMGIIPSLIMWGAIILVVRLIIHR